MLKTLPALAALVVTALFVAPTVTQAAETNYVRVSYADLNLASDSGQYALRGRIAYAARVVCDLEDSKQLDVAKATNLCRSDSIAHAEPAFEAAIAEARHPSVVVGGAASLIVTAE
jgi:UrcA family protein